MQNKNHVGRAKLFLSFDALKGFRSYIKEKERVIVQRPSLSEDDYFNLDRKIHYIKKSYLSQQKSIDNVTLIYYTVNVSNKWRKTKY